MLNTLTGLLDARRDRKSLLRLRWMLDAYQKLLIAHDVTLIVRIGSRVRSQLEHRFGPDREVFIHTDKALEKEEQRIEFLPPEKQIELSRNFSLLAERTSPDGDVAEAMSWRLIAMWLEAKAIARKSTNKNIAKEARDFEGICFFHIANSLRVLRGDSPKLDDATPP
jgi:hypothetical protein